MEISFLTSRSCLCNTSISLEILLRSLFMFSSSLCASSSWCWMSARCRSWACSPQEKVRTVPPSTCLLASTWEHGSTNTGQTITVTTITSRLSSSSW